LGLRKQDPDDLWEEIRGIIIEAAMKSITEKRKKNGPKWLTERTFKITEDRQEAKQAGNRADVRRLNSELQREARKDTERFIKEKC
jgi:replication initiation and membrane attachment protein DnaB